MKIEQDYDLENLNTFRVPARAKFFTVIEQEKDIEELFSFPEFKNSEKLFLGGGSNVLLTKDFDGIVIQNKLKGIELVADGQNEVLIRARSGEVWHDLVNFVVERGYWGIENLAFIPGSVGAAPMQNIGAYGVELKGVLENVEAYDVSGSSPKKRIFQKEECEFGYRDSIFKNALKGKYFISAITLRLSKKANPKIDYIHLKEYLDQNKVEVKNSKDVSDAVTSVRKSKLPNPAIIPNAGSFFKNLFVTKGELDELLKKYPDLPYFDEGEVKKVPVAWFIEHSGPANGASWKGYKAGKVGVHERQALVLVNHDGGKGEDIKNLADEIIDSVYKKFGIKLVPEVNLI